MNGTLGENSLFIEFFVVKWVTVNGTNYTNGSFLALVSGFDENSEMPTCAKVDQILSRN